MSPKALAQAGLLLAALVNCSPIFQFAPSQTTTATTLAKRIKPDGAMDTDYVVDSQGDAPAGSAQAYLTGAEVGANGILTFTTSQTVGTTWTTGASLTLDPGAIFNVGLSVSVATTTSTATGYSAGYTCPTGASSDPYTCSLMVTPNLWQVNGHVNYHETAGTCNSLVAGT